MGGCFSWICRGPAQLDVKNGDCLRQRVLDAVAHCEESPVLEEILELLHRSQEASFATLSFDPLPKRSSHSRKTVLESSLVLRALDDFKRSPYKIGMDIGGTLTKMAVLEFNMNTCDIAARFGEAGEAHPSLQFEVPFEVSSSASSKIHFISGSTAVLEKTLENLQAFEMRRAVPRRVIASGGGAHRFARAVRELMNVELVPFQEMESLVVGLDFLHRYGPEAEVFRVNDKDAEEHCCWPSELYPCLLVNMGSGVSILRIDGPPCVDDSGCHQPTYVRLGGTACGGATFLGLASLITSTSSFKEIIELASHGDASQVNKLVRDIYGDEGCSQLGLPPTMTAAHFGKFISAQGHKKHSVSEADAAAALLLMVVQESSILARAFAHIVELQLKLEGLQRAPPIFFVGGFVVENTVAQKAIARTFRNLRLPAPMFLRHADFLGALGSLTQCIARHGRMTCPVLSE